MVQYFVSHLSPGNLSAKRVFLKTLLFLFVLQAGVEQKVDLRLQPALKTLGTVSLFFVCCVLNLTGEQFPDAKVCVYLKFPEITYPSIVSQICKAQSIELISKS